MNIFKRVLLAVDQGACLIITGQNDFTLSGWAYVRKVEKGKSFYNNAINKLFFWQPEHCANALVWEVNEAEKSLKKHYKLRDTARAELSKQE